MAKSTVSMMRYWLATSLVCPLFFSCGWIDLGGDQAIGRPCELSGNPGPSQGVFTTGASECPSELCLKPAVQPGASGAGDTGPTCSGECGVDSDCGGELRDPTNPLDTRCAKGFSCGIPFVKGPLCCKKLCVCRDFLGPAGLPTPIACQGSGAMSCSGPTAEPTGVEEVTDAYISLAPIRQIDLVTMVDNSPGMAPKIAKLNAQFPTLIAALRDPTDGTLPDLRVAIIDSDLGTGGAYNDGLSCAPNTENGGSAWGDSGKFMMVGATGCGVNSPDAKWLEYTNGQAVNYTGDINQVFACLATNLGVQGCGEEHQLQAFEWALAAKGVGNDDQQRNFLRANATLGLVFLSDEDDCSAATDDGLFGQGPIGGNDVSGESASLRCATRAHACGGRNLTVSPPGYPTDAPYSHPFSDCIARTDSCPNPTDGTGTTDTARPTDCSPLKDIRHLVDEIKSLKADPASQILVAGIFGWPLSDADMATAEYKIAPVPSSNTADATHPTVFDYWPVCYDPNHLPSPTTTDPVTGFDATAAAWGATGGLRESAFIDQFGASGMKFSICEPDFSTSMLSIGSALARKMRNECFDRKLVDADLAAAGIQPDCRVVLLTPKVTVGYVTYAESPAALPQCAPGETSASAAMDCWQLTSDTSQCPATGQRIALVRTAAEVAAQPQLDPGIELKMECRTCPDLPAGSVVMAGCDY